MKKRWGFLPRRRGSYLRVDERDVNLQDERATSAGVMMGVDGKIGDHVVAGALASYNNTDANMDSNGSHVDINSYSSGIYAGYHNEGFYANGLAVYSRNHYDSNRDILFPGFTRFATRDHGQQSSHGKPRRRL